MKILILYTELAGYVVSCINEASLNPAIKEIHVVRYPINSEAPFTFEFHDKVKIYKRNEWTNKKLLELAVQLKPDVVLCSGWIDKTYVKICKQLKKSSKTVLTMDNHWKGSLKQYALKMVSGFTIHRAFSYSWVPGKPQKEYSLKLGFKPNAIFEGFYVTDTTSLSKLFEVKKKSKRVPKVFICAARYIPAKGLETLWNAFIMLKKRDKTDWQLWCAGQGENFDERIEYEGIKHLGFVQPIELESLMLETGVFVLPSVFEPWGVAVQEFAVAGFPLVLSNKIGSSDSFLKEKKNGYSFKANDVNDLYFKLLQVTLLSESELLQMSSVSNNHGSRLTIENWVKTLILIGSNGSV